MVVNEIQIANNFWLNEFECPCCKRVILHPQLLIYLVKLRHLIDHPIIINSGYRCKNNNAQVGGVPTSYHLFGMAVDIYVKNYAISDLALNAQCAGFSGTGLYDTFLHLDIRRQKKSWDNRK